MYLFIYFSSSKILGVTVWINVVFKTTLIEIVGIG